MEDFLIYGTQYYRCPTPLREDWERDMANIRKNGMNFIKLWVQWRSNNPKEGVFDFTDIRDLLDIAYKNDLKVMLNLVLDVAPAWVFKKYPDSVMVMANGEKLYPRSLAHRQMGGTPAPCMHHPETTRLKYDFTEAAAKELSGHPAMCGWDVDSEPELTNSIAREADAGRMACYCEHSVNAFRAWVEKKYGTIEKLNAAWLRCYNDFSEVEAPRCGAVYKDMIDWRLFFADSITQDVYKRIEIVRKYCGDQIVMVHTVPMPYFNMINACSDDYQMAKKCDMFGNSIGHRPFTAAQALGAAAGKTVINAEIHAVPGESFRRPAIQYMEDFRKQIYVPLSRGMKGWVYWQYRRELCGREGPAWGLTKLNGDPDYRLDFAREIGNTLQKHKDLILSVQPQKAPIAIIRDYNNEIFSFCARDTVSDFLRSVEGAFDAFYSLNYNVDIISDVQAQETDLSVYKMIYYPMPYYTSNGMAACLKKYVEEGGTLVAEANFGAYRDEVNLHSTQVPGYGFDAVFGCEEGRCTSTASVVAAYGSQWTQDTQDTLDMAEGPCGSWKGYLFLEELVPTTAEVLGAYADKQLHLNTLTRNRYGKGQAILCGTLPGAAYAVTRHEGTRQLFGLFAHMAGVECDPMQAEGARIDLLRGDKGVLLAVNQFNKEERTFDVPVEGVAELEEVESGAKFPVENGVCCVTVPADSVRLFAGYR